MHADKTDFEKALFAGGCFWCMEKPFEALDGVRSVISGYAGGTAANPTYGDYAAGGYLEVVEISYDPAKVSYEKLLDVFWHQIDPTDGGGQFVDRGHAYTSCRPRHSIRPKTIIRITTGKTRFATGIIATVPVEIDFLTGFGARITTNRS